MATEKYANLAISHLTGDITNSQTSITVTDASLFPAAGNFRIAIESEIILVTGVSSNTFTVTRGIESSTAVSHESGTSVALVITAGSMKQLFDDRVGIGTFSSLPASEFGNRLYYSTDTSTLSFDDGTGWIHNFGLYKATSVLDGNYPWFSQGTATSTQYGPSLWIGNTTHETNTPIRGKGDALTVPYTLTVGMLPQLVQGGDFSSAGILVYDSLNKLILFQFSSEGGFTSLSIEARSGFAATTADAVYSDDSFGYYGPLYLRIANNSTTRTFSFSTNGNTFTQVFSHAAGTHMVENHFGFGVRYGSLGSRFGEVGSQFFSVSLT